MKRYIHASKANDITNEYLRELFNKIDWDDIDWADRFIDKVLKKELGVDHPFDQAEYINMLNPEVRDELMSFLADPKAVHNQRMKNKRSARKKAKEGQTTELEVFYDAYRGYTTLPNRKIKVKGSSLLDALRKMCDKLTLYLTSEDIDLDDMTPSEIIDRIESENGDGCDFIMYIKNLTTNELLLEADYDRDMEDDI